MAIDIDSIKRLKDLTGVGLTDAKKALEETNGDFDKALKNMRAKGLTKAEKRGEREARAGVIGTYNHDDRIGVIIEVNCETDFVARNDIFKNLVKDLSMHVAASNPEYVSVEDVPASAKKKVEDEFKQTAKKSGKTADVTKKIVEGQVKKYFDERCLLNQPFVKNPDVTVSEYVKENAARLGENIVVRRFARFALGEVS
ncbi:MAG TPA: translation elongation factor Ts [Candidatus Sulfotelmatobacter sp.]|nr:translation elongation factor Ts [Candidatus Sulfotelmatobacter sp.]